MNIKTYGLYDTVAQQFVRTFTAKNDDDANRAAKYIVREKDFDPIAGLDYEIKHLYDMNTETGVVSDNDVKFIASLREAYEEYQVEKEKSNA